LSTDHARERVPALVVGDAVRPIRLSERSTFADLGATTAEWLGIDFRGDGSSFLRAITP
jgi:phosphopentomutase